MEKVMLKDIAGYEAEKAEAIKIIDFLKNYQEYVSEGITLPKGLILTGVPGVGKTLLAKAIANESKARFIEFMNTDNNPVLNVHEAFKEAKRELPSILFIDEIDQLVGVNVYDELSDQGKVVLQALLMEIDGLESSDGVIVIAACNNRYDLPKALLRSGRLEKQMTLKEPTYECRIKIFDYYLNKHPMLKNIDREKLAKKSDKLTGADIKNLCNEVLLESKALKRKPIFDDFERYIPQIINKDIKKDNDSSELLSIASHEIGHFICNYKLRGEIASISVERYNETLGFTRREKREGIKFKFSDFYNEVTCLLGGLAGEKVITNDFSNGATGDIKKVESIIKTAFNLGAFGFEYLKIPSEIIGRDEVISDEKYARLENKEAEIMNEALLKAETLIKENIRIYEVLSPKLIEKGRLSAEKIEEILKNYNL